MIKKITAIKCILPIQSECGCKYFCKYICKCNDVNLPFF